MLDHLSDFHPVKYRLHLAERHSRLRHAPRTGVHAEKEYLLRAGTVEFKVPFPATRRVLEWIVDVADLRREKGEVRETFGKPRGAVDEVCGVIHRVMLPRVGILHKLQRQRYSWRVNDVQVVQQIDLPRGGVRHPRGFSFYATECRFSPAERPDLTDLAMGVSAVVNEGPQAVACGVTTSNRVCGAPVVVARERLAAGRLRAIVVNTKVANVGSPSGEEDTRRVAREAAAVFDVPEEETLSMSTGVIGWRLPVETISHAVSTLPRHHSDVLGVARRMMTTDRYPKAFSHTDGGGVTCTGVAKGAGMIEPHMATMLGILMCDARVDRARLDRVVRRVVAITFNRISVDSDQSTSDMVVAIANGASGVEITDEDELRRLIEPVCRDLAYEIVRNGEGTAHVMRVWVRGITSEQLSEDVARHVANSPLVKTAVYGNDPNVGRIVAAVGDALSRYDATGGVETASLCVTLGDTLVYRHGRFLLDENTESALAEYLRGCRIDPTHDRLHDRHPVEIAISFSGGSGEVCIMGSDLSYEYVRENADYRT